MVCVFRQSGQESLISYRLVRRTVSEDDMKSATGCCVRNEKEALDRDVQPASLGVK